ncbi:MAG TPA: hypothetical protein PK450_13280, partial [Paracoccaceae bacterium]|nr:hypothetical protein [Paracoccaceae bacterium]
MTGERLVGAASQILGATLLGAAIWVTDAMLGWPTALIDRWYFSVLGVAFLALGICLKREAAAFGVLAFFLITGGAAQLYVTEPLWFPALHLNPQTWKEWTTFAVI